MTNEVSSIEDIRARTSQCVTEIVANPREYYRVQQILRDRADLLAHCDRLTRELAEARDLIAHAIGGSDEARLRERNAALEGALRLILPLAKGYAPENQSDSARHTCNSWVVAAEDVLNDPIQGEPSGNPFDCAAISGRSGEKTHQHELRDAGAVQSCGSVPRYDGPTREFRCEFLNGSQCMCSCKHLLLAMICGNSAGLSVAH